MASTISTRSPEVNAGTTTSWLPMSTAWQSIPGCQSYFWKVGPATAVLAGWDPGYGIYVQQGLSCQPPQVTTWWDAEHMYVNVEATQYSLGPVVCPEAYSTATTSLNAGGSTFVGCCPSGYSFVNFDGAGNADECISKVSPGEVVEFATYSISSWVISTSTVQTESVVNGIQVNGWLFPSSTTAQSSSPTTTQSSSPTTTQSSSPTLQSFSSTTETSLATEASSTGLSASTTVGIAVGVPLAVIAIALLALAFFFFRRAKAAPTAAMNSGGMQIIPNAVKLNSPEGLNAPAELYRATAVQGYSAELPTKQL